MTYPLVAELADAGIPVTVSCRVFKLPRQPCYRWRRSPVRDADLLGAHRIHALRAARDGDPPFRYRCLREEARRARRCSRATSSGSSVATNRTGSLCCCAIKDVFSNRVVGYLISDRMTAKLAVDEPRTDSAG